jgi:hypothetical protein
MHDINYATSVHSVTQLIKQTPVFRNVTGDGTVPLEEALTEPLSSKYLYFGQEDHRHMIRDDALISDVISILRGYPYSFGILEPADKQPENLCRVNTPTDEPVSTPVGTPESPPDRPLIIIIVAVSCFAIIAVVLAVVISRLRSKKKNYQQI